VQQAKACAIEDLKHRAQLQNTLAGACEDMCKEVGAYPKCDCPAFVAPDATPGVVTWPELLEYLDKLGSWGYDLLRKWRATASALQIQNAMQAAFAQVHAKGSQVQEDKACAAEDLKHRVQVHNKLAGYCEDMCKEVGSYPKCPQCPDFVTPDSTPGVFTWPELNQHMDQLVEWSGPRGLLKAWQKRAASVLQKNNSAVKTGKAVKKDAPYITFQGGQNADLEVDVPCKTCVRVAVETYYAHVEICADGMVEFYAQEGCVAANLNITLPGGATCMTGTAPSPVRSVKHVAC